VKEKRTHFEQRKVDHIRESLRLENQALGQTGLEAIHLFHQSLPELNWEELRLETPVLGGRSLATPFFIAGMTAGHRQARKLNEQLAAACERRGWALGLGSQRRDLENALQDPSKPWQEWEGFRKAFPSLCLVGNLGLSQIISAPSDSIGELVRRSGVDALAIHLNPLQEVLQPEGTPQFRGGLAALERLAAATDLKIPLVVKETGCGFSEASLKRLAQLPLAAVDVSGLGGTHWGRIEGARAAPESQQARAAAVFSFWGESTVDSVLRAARSLPSRTAVWASGGVRTGLDAAKLITLGAHRVGYAQPALKAALEGDAALDAWMEQQEFELKVALFCLGCQTPEDLRGRSDLWIQLPAPGSRGQAHAD
jgi:isopentenyl-diphosphate delta-isomerase